MCAQHLGKNFPYKKCEENNLFKVYDFAHVIVCRAI